MEGFSMNQLFKKLISITISLSFIFLSACAPRSGAITPKNVSVTQYQTLECEQVKTELRLVTDSLANASSQQDSKASSDTAIAWIGILIWPIWLILFTENEPFNVAELKGQQKALEHSLIAKC